MLVDEFLKGSNDLNMVGLGAAFVAALSTFSFPGIPLCPGAQMKTIGIEAALHVSWRMCMRGTRGGGCWLRNCVKCCEAIRD